ncbi:hypothetical protein ACFO1B_41665 [Dactylosporangium siamense]|uniref:Restriction endonuclease type IV Mrr domain-containing protein n=1 Tax=Dactylosporangium siamense TaxID=685454 RepID=A0A919PJ78_9ACTN|nr:hypothetical protein [Dactylosporangium siamense]GIG44924.1 hypothetical protein Dsi01nite_029650 [Dactylosporangium siamense]
MSAIRWDRLDPATIEHAIQMLLVDLYDGARPIDGRGGDGGRDVRWDSTDGLVIFEIKSFAVRLTKTQRREVERSLAQAINHSPACWVLVLPLDHSPAEETWFDDLQRDHPDVKLVWRGLQWLNGHLGTREHLRRFVEGESYELLTLAQQFGMEQAVITTVDDLVERVARLRDRGQALTPHRLDFATTADGVMLNLTSQLPTDQLDPDSLDELFTFPADDPSATAVRQQLTDVLDYGGDITVDGRYLRPDADLRASSIGELFQLSGPTGQLQITTRTVMTGPPPTYQLVLVAATGTVKHRLGMFPQQPPTIGRRGLRVTVGDPAALFTAVLQADRPELGGAVRAHLTGRAAGKYPYAISGAYEVFRQAESTDRLELRVNDRRLGSPFVVTEARMVDLIASARHAADIIAALERVQAHTGQQFPIPDEIPPDEAADLLDAVRLLDGEEIRTDKNAVLLTVRSDRLADFVAMHETLPPGGMLMEPANYIVYCGGRTLDLGNVTIRAPRLSLANLPELRAAVGGTDDAVARYVCTDDEGIYAGRPANT